MCINPLLRQVNVFLKLNISTFQIRTGERRNGDAQLLIQIWFAGSPLTTIIRATLCVNDSTSKRRLPVTVITIWLMIYGSDVITRSLTSIVIYIIVNQQTFCDLVVQVVKLRRTAVATCESLMMRIRDTLARWQNGCRVYLGHWFTILGLSWDFAAALVKISYLIDQEMIQKGNHFDINPIYRHRRYLSPRKPSWNWHTGLNIIAMVKGLDIRLFIER